jgi:hypothetical protein
MPSPPQRPIAIRKLGDFLANPGYALSASCPSCPHSEPLDVRRLVDRFGGDIEPRELALLLRCRQCDHKGGEIRVSTVGYRPRA